MPPDMPSDGAALDAGDVCSDWCRIRRGAQVESLRAGDADGWKGALVEDRSVTPAELAASRIDYPAWLASVPGRGRRIAEALAVGELAGTVAARFRLSAGRISQLRRELRAAWLRFHDDAALPAAA